MPCVSELGQFPAPRPARYERTFVASCEACGTLDETVVRDEHEVAVAFDAWTERHGECEGDFSHALTPWRAAG